MGGEELLVGRHDRLARRQGPLHQAAGGIDAPDHLHHDIDGGVVHEALGVTGDQLGGDPGARPAGVAHGDTGELQAHP